MPLFSRKKNCNICGKKTNEKDLWELHMNTSDGIHKVVMCSECAKEFEEIKDNALEWLKNQWT
jgi:hypothetical protein